MASILITGGTGLVGTALTHSLIADGHRVIILSRTKKTSTHPSIQYALWDIDKEWIEAGAIEAADAIVHLAGASVAEKRWTKKRKQEIVDSRVKTGRLLLKYLKNTQHHVNSFVSASAIGWYGPDTSKSLTDGFVETDPADSSFLGETCKQWEAAVSDLPTTIRLVILRTGIVLAKSGGALKEFMKPASKGFATIMGSGNQLMSWIALEDLVRIYNTAIFNHELNGIYNAVAPIHITNKKFMLMLTRKLKGPLFISIHIPAFVLKMVLGEMSIEVLKSATVSANKIKQSGFTFLSPSADVALDKILNPPSTTQ